MAKRDVDPQSDRAATGRRTRFKYSFLKILSGSDLSRRRLPYMQAAAPKRGPHVWMTACAHGDEVGGIVVVQEVFRRLRKQPLTKGTLHAFPLMNPLGFEAGTRLVSFSDEDLNRSFPGNPAGTLAERIAAKIFGTIVETDPAVVLDLHNDWRRSIPYAVLDPPSPSFPADLQARTQALAAATGFPVVTEPDPLRKTLSHSLLQRGVAAVTVELGESYVVNETNVEFGVQSTLNVLADLGMLPPRATPFRYPLPDDVMGRPLLYSQEPVSSTSGILRFLVGAGATVRTGQPVAKVYNAFGRLQETMTALHDGIVLGHSDSSVAFPGAAVMAFGLLK